MCRSRTKALKKMKMSSLAAVIHQCKRDAAGNSAKAVHTWSIWGRNYPVAVFRSDNRFASDSSTFKYTAKANSSYVVNSNVHCAALQSAHKHFGVRSRNRKPKRKFPVYSSSVCLIG